MYVLCVRECIVYTHAHTLHAGYSDVSLGFGTGNLESLEEIQMYCSASIHVYCTSVRSTYVRIDARLCVEVWTNCHFWHCNTLQHAATDCNTLQHTATHLFVLNNEQILNDYSHLYYSVCHSVLQCVAK